MRQAITVFALCLFVSTGFADDTATFLNHTDAGCDLVTGPGYPGQAGVYTPTDDPAVLWQYNVEWPIYTTTSNTNSGWVFAGTYLNDPYEVELFADDGVGTPLWTYQGTEWYADASDDGFVLGAIDEDASGITVYKWTGPGTGTPDWSSFYTGAYVGGYGPYFCVSRDGSTLVAAITENAETRLLMFDAGSSTPLVNHLASGLSFPRGLQISSDGRYAGVRTNTYAIIWDRDLNVAREEIYIGYGSTPFDISGDASLIAYGWTSLTVREWSGSSYQQLWTRSESGYYLSTVAISPDGSTVIAGWYNTSFTGARITVHDRVSSVPIWTYDYLPSSGVYQESVRRIDTSTDGRWIMVGSWGDIDNINPEVHIFDREAGGAVYFTADLPGSVFSVDIEDDGSFASAGAKNVHANQSGHGGDLVQIDLDLSTSPIVPSISAVNPPVFIPPTGGSFDFNLELTNASTGAETFDAWIMIDIPGLGWMGPFYGPAELTIPGSTTVERTKSQAVPSIAPAGTYTMEIRVGEWGGDIWATDNFTFEKLGGSDAGFVVEDWITSSNSGSSDWLAEGVVDDFQLVGVYPNPFNPSTVISYTLQDASFMTLAVYDVTGREVARLVDGWRDAGLHEVTFDGSGLASGVYLYRLEAGDVTAQGKMVLLK